MTRKRIRNKMESKMHKSEVDLENKRKREEADLVGIDRRREERRGMRMVRKVMQEV